MIKIGITGGIASGKSIAASYCESNGAYVFNADRESKKHLKKSLKLQKKSYKFLVIKLHLKIKLI